MPEQERGIPQSQRAVKEEGASPKKRAFPAHGMHKWGIPQTNPNNQGVPPDQCAPQAHGVQRGGGEVGAGPQPEGEGVPPPKQLCTPFVRGLKEEMGETPKT